MKNHLGEFYANGGYPYKSQSDLVSLPNAQAREQMADRLQVLGTGFPVVHVIECRHPATAAMAKLIDDMSDKGRRQADAILRVISRFDKGQR